MPRDAATSTAARLSSRLFGSYLSRPAHSWAVIPNSGAVRSHTHATLLFSVFVLLVLPRASRSSSFLRVRCFLPRSSVVVDPRPSSRLVVSLSPPSPPSCLPLSSVSSSSAPLLLVCLAPVRLVRAPRWTHDGHCCPATMCPLLPLHTRAGTDPAPALRAVGPPSLLTSIARRASSSSLYAAGSACRTHCLDCIRWGWGRQSCRLVRSVCSFVCSSRYSSSLQATPRLIDPILLLLLRRPTRRQQSFQLISSANVAEGQADSQPATRGEASRKHDSEGNSNGAQRRKRSARRTTQRRGVRHCRNTTGKG